MYKQDAQTVFSKRLAGNEVIVEVDFGVRTCVWSQLDSQQIEGTMKLIRVIFVSALIMVATAAAPQQPTSQMSKAGVLRTNVVLLGTGTPVPDPERSGPHYGQVDGG